MDRWILFRCRVCKGMYWLEHRRLGCKVWSARCYFKICRRQTLLTCLLKVPTQCLLSLSSSRPIKDKGILVRLKYDDLNSKPVHLRLSRFLDVLGNCNQIIDTFLLSSHFLPFLEDCRRNEIARFRTNISLSINRRFRRCRSSIIIIK